MGLEEIFKGIDEKVEQEVDKIKQEAEAERKKILEAASKGAREQKERIIDENKRQIDDEMRRKLVEVRREEKKNILMLKSEMMHQVYEKAKNKFLELDDKEYIPLVKDTLLANIKWGDEEILVSPRDKRIFSKDFLREIEKVVDAQGLKPALRLSFKLDEGERGFIVKSEDVQVNATISTLFSMVSDREEIEIARRLFSIK